MKKYLLAGSVFLLIFSCAKNTPEINPDQQSGKSRSGSACGRLNPGEYLDKGQSLASCDGKTILVHQQDGNVVQYDQNGWLWQSGTSGKLTTRFIMQKDGNLVLYNGSSPLWNSGTQGNTNAYLALQGDCNLVVYNSSSNPIWATYRFCRAFSGGNYVIKASHSLKCADVAAFSTADGGNIQQWSCSGSKNQQWAVNNLNNGFYQIQSLHSGKCLDVASFSTVNGGNIQQWSCSNGYNQQWKILPAGENKYKIISRNSNKVMDVSSISQTDGANIYQWDDVRGANQQWFFEPVSSGFWEPVGNGTRRSDIYVQLGDYNSAFGGYHLGRDVPASEGETVIAPADGEVIHIARSNVGICINTVTIRHNDGKCSSYCHINANSNIFVGTRLTQGTPFASIGRYEPNYIPHLHYAVLDQNLCNAISSVPVCGYAPGGYWENGGYRANGNNCGRSENYSAGLFIDPRNILTK